MKRKLDLDAWPRKAHFDFFKGFDEPFFGVCVDVDCTQTYARCQHEEVSFFLCYLHSALAAANAVEPFRLRIEDGAVYVHDRVHASPTIARPNGTFGYAYIEYRPDWAPFEAAAQQEIARVRASDELDPAMAGENVLHISSLPWLDFNAVSHARHFKGEDSSPKICFGKVTETASGRQSMPVSVHAHHALVDGRHVGAFVDAFQHRLNDPPLT